MPRVKKKDKHKITVYLTTEEFLIFEREFLIFNKTFNLDISLGEFFVKIFKDYLARMTKSKRKYINYKFLEP